MVLVAARRRGRAMTNLWLNVFAVLVLVGAVCYLTLVPYMD